MIAPFAAGAPVDLVGRIVAERMRLSLGQPIIIENISGAAGGLGVTRAAHATPVGYTERIASSLRRPTKAPAVGIISSLWIGLIAWTAKCISIKSAAKPRCSGSEWTGSHVRDE
jgi:hypothetical protein